MGVFDSVVEMELLAVEILHEVYMELIVVAFDVWCIPFVAYSLLALSALNQKLGMNDVFLRAHAVEPSENEQNIKLKRNANGSDQMHLITGCNACVGILG